MEDSNLNNSIELMIVSFLAGSISEEDLQQLNRWINKSDENRKYFNSLKDSWIISGEKNSGMIMSTEESWTRFKLKLNQGESGSGSGNLRKFNYRKYVKLAASWLLIFGSGSILTWWISRERAETTPADKIIEISTPLGAQSMIKMPDSSLIWLNAGTRITYSQDYGVHTRTLNLNGEAYFDVAKDSLHPFVVNTEAIVVSALGTRFNIKAYPEDDAIYTTLEEGKIDIRILTAGYKKKRIVLESKDKFIYQKEAGRGGKSGKNAEETDNPPRSVKVAQNGIRILTNVRTELDTSWKDPRWIIDSEPLGSLALKLERRFNLKIKFADKQLMKYKFTGTIENETINLILDALKLTAPLDYQIKKDTVTLFTDISTKEKFMKVMSSKN
jgi:ferric-dicitrate binding protein FerR (iron transport regulator)